MKPRHVYTLADPRDGSIRYVGCSSQSMASRLSGHIYGARSGRDKSKRADWIRVLLGAGVVPVMSLLETVPAGEWETAEQRWIARHRALGADLVNSTDGGAGSPGWVMGDEQRALVADVTRKRNTGCVFSEQRRANMSSAQKSLPDDVKARLSAEKSDRMKNWSPEKREQVAAKLRGRKASDETRKAMSDARQNVSEETRQKLRDAWARRPEELKRMNGTWSRGVPKSAETRARMSEAAKQRWARERLKKEVA